MLALLQQDSTGLQISMRFLFQIIAGLLLADLFKQSVEVLNISRAVDNLRVIAASAAFLIRLVVDNYIFYEGADLPPGTPVAYVVRIVLLLIDLAAFAFAYDIVHQVSAAGLVGPRRVFTFVRVRRILIGMASIEALHTAWGVIETISAVGPRSSLHAVLIGTTGGTVTGRWLLLSAVFAVLPLPLIRMIRPRDEPCDKKSSWLVLAFSLVSAVTYAAFLMDYYVGRLKP